MELYIWSGESTRGLASFDLESLQILTYIKFSQAPVTIHKIGSPHLSPCGVIPAFLCDDKIYTKFSEIIMHLRMKNFCCDYELSPRQCAESLAYKTMLLEKLHPALVYLQWVEPQTYFEITRKLYFENGSFPYKFWIPGQKRKLNKEYFEAITNEDSDPAEVESEIFTEAKKVLNCLSDKLNDHEYFFGRNPSTVDACIYPYLVFILKCGAKEKDLKTHIESCPILIRFVENINKRYFPIAKQEPSKEPIAGLQNNTRNYIMSALVASAAMFTYGVAAGIIQVDTNRIKDVEVNGNEFC